MTLRSAVTLTLCASAVLLIAGCVEYVPVAADSPPPPPPQPVYPPAYASAPPQAPAPAPVYESAPPSPPDGPSPAQPANGLDRLLRPIALYPDPLLALILPASTYPGDLASAQAYFVQYGDATQVDAQPWDASVRALAHYPTVIQWLAENPAWTQAVGAAFLQSPQDVMGAVQRLRRIAVNSGVLASNPEQQVYFDGQNIDILPGAPNAIFVPAYDGDAIFQEDTDNGFQGDYINYGPAYPIGPWLAFCVDWNTRGVWVGGYNSWHGPSGSQVPHFDAERRPPQAQPWHRQQGASSPAPVRRIQSGPPPSPVPMRGAPRSGQVHAQGTAPARTSAPTRTTQVKPEPETRAPTPMPRVRLPAAETQVPQQHSTNPVARPSEPAPRQYSNAPGQQQTYPQTRSQSPETRETKDTHETAPKTTAPSRSEPSHEAPRPAPAPAPQAPTPGPSH